MILVFDRGNAISRAFNSANFEKGTLSDIWQIKRESDRPKNHGATFPKKLVSKIIENFTKENDLIYDPFCGSGTTCYVAKQLNRNYLGSEVVRDYYDYSVKRLENLQQQLF